MISLFNSIAALISPELMSTEKGTGSEVGSTENTRYWMAPPKAPVHTVASSHITMQITASL